MSRCRFAPNGRPRYELGLTNNTIVWFSSDNGGISSRDAYSTNNLPLYSGKGRQWASGTRESYYIKAPGTPLQAHHVRCL